MKYFIFSVSIALSVLLLSCSRSEKRAELKTFQDSVSYSIGIDISNNLKAQMVEVNPDVVAQALKDMRDNGQPVLSPKDAHVVLMRYQMDLMAKHSDKNIKDGQAYLEQNKKKEGVVTLPDGLQYRVIKEGTGKKPAPTDNVKVNYKGSLIDGTVFDSSESHGGPAVFPVSKIVPGLSEALKLMQVGSKWEIVVPSELGYGAQPAGALITPNSVLVFEIELLGIQK